MAAQAVTPCESQNMIHASLLIMKKILEEFGIVSTALQNPKVLLSDANFAVVLYTTCDKYKEWLSNSATEDGFISLLKPVLEICNACGIETTGARERKKGVCSG